MFKVNKKTPERRHLSRSGVYIVTFEHISLFFSFIVDFNSFMTGTVIVEKPVH